MLHGLTDMLLKIDCPAMQGLLQMKANQGAGIMLVRAGLREHNRQAPQGWLGLQAQYASPEGAAGAARGYCCLHQSTQPSCTQPGQGRILWL